MANYGNNIPPVSNQSTPYPTQQQVPIPPQPYPTQFSSVPAASGYTGYPGAPPPYAPAPMGSQPSPYGQPGVAYPPAPGQQAYPAQQPYPGQYPGMPQPPTAVVHQGGFDAGARFDMTGPTLPPPPPGVAPTVSQMAAAHGQNVVVTQRRGDFVSGGSDGGMVLW